jgi:hypothetical protein
MGMRGWTMGTGVEVRQKRWVMLKISVDTGNCAMGLAAIEVCGIIDMGYNCIYRASLHGKAQATEVQPLPVLQDLDENKRSISFISFL